MLRYVKFSVGESHPAYNVPVLATVTPCTGYNGLKVFGKSLDKVYFPEDKEGIAIVKGNPEGAHEVIRFETRPAYEAIVDTWVSEVYDDKLGGWISAEKFSRYFTYLSLKKEFEDVA